MKRLGVELTHCYGIKKLKAEFDFSKNRACAIYAPNGAMKSSFAQTFQDAADGIPSGDRIFTARTSERRIYDENEKDVPSGSIFVVRPYDEELGPTEKHSTLLLDAQLKKEYEQLYQEIEHSKAALMKALKGCSHTKRDIEQELTDAFVADDFYVALHRIRRELDEQSENPFGDVQYDTVFDDRVLSTLGTKNVKDALEGYIQRYNELLEASTFFKKGTFDYYNAGQIAKSLARNGFFDAKHSVNLNSGARLEIHTQEELEAVIAKEKDQILKDKRLRAKFDEVELILAKNEALREFQRYVMDRPELLSQFSNIARFKQNVWKSYLKSNYELYIDLITKHENAQRRQKEIEEKAKQQQTHWEETIKIFNERFIVPFRLEVANKLHVVCGREQILKLGFTYTDGAEKASIKKDELLERLSMGEKRALYLLNVIFEVEMRKSSNQETLMVVDDIADSFDYQNKYAIIQYLKEINDDPKFKQIIMTHNFDFYRTIINRFVVDYSNCLMSSKTNNGITLEKAAGIKNVFVNDWKKKFFTDNKKKIASIPFLRNLIEYTKGDSDPNFLTLTSLLHFKANTEEITVADLDKIYTAVCGIAGGSANAAKTVVDLIAEEAKSCVQTENASFEGKIVVAIATRLAAEAFMVGRIEDQQFLDGITSNQADKLLSRFKKDFPQERDAIRVLDKVQLMTPENIHLNSFMYEPIVDMSPNHLHQLFVEVLQLR